MKKILFIDFDGTICFDRFWKSLSKDEYEKIQKYLFKDNIKIVNDWMRGKHTMEEINLLLSEKLSLDYNYLYSTFKSDCENMKIEKNVLENLERLREKYILILVTGNMDCFSRITKKRLNLEKYFHEIYNSSDSGVFKYENDGQLFLDISKKYSIDISNTCLFDDSEKVCEVFRKLGGKVFKVSQNQKIQDYLKDF
jgi:FMN phosphatase YigB (HAD superfamily)